MQTVNENLSRYTKREIEAAQEAKSAFIKLGRPSMKDFKELVTKAKLTNCLLTVKEIDCAQEAQELTQK